MSKQWGYQRSLLISILWCNFLGCAIPQYVPHYVGDVCSTKETRPLAGECKRFQDCASAISNYRAGVSPTLCGPVKNGNVIVCCPTEERIGAAKCREYSQLSRRATPLLPLIANVRRPVTNPLIDTRVDLDLRAGSSCVVRPEAYIVNGRHAKTGEFPYMVALGFLDLKDKRWGCGGTLISDEFVLTAAHCVETRHGPPRRVLVGDIYLENPGTGRKALAQVKEAFVHPGYKKPATYNDIALLRLAKRISLSPNIQPACLPQPERRLEHVDHFLASGWGRVDTGEAQSNILQAVTLQRINTTSCNEAYDHNVQKRLRWPQGIIKSQFCAGDDKKDTCDGDSGGPLAVKSEDGCVPTVVGITSFGPTICGTGVPGVYTNVQSYLDWIESIVWPETYTRIESESDSDTLFFE